ncbi:glycosyltransferase family 61 protein [Adhaeretor mobilis]|nr:glycosyltransferase family 61 protein [Adhaeretor mobilis]
MKSDDQPPVPRRWFRLGKYLLPIGVKQATWRRTKSPSEQVSVADLAAQHPEQVAVETFGSEELLPEYSYACFQAGVITEKALPSKMCPAAFVARIRDGMSFGRHCCAMGPAGKAVRETGFNLDGQVRNQGSSMSSLRPRHWRRRLEGDVTFRPWLPPKHRIDGRVALLNTRTSHNYFHWLIDILPRLMSLKKLGVMPDYYLVESLSESQKKAFEFLGIDRDQLIQPHCRMLIEADELLVPSLPSPTCLRDFGRFATEKLGVQPQIGFGKRIYITRRSTGNRTIANESQLIEMLAARGFETHAMEDYSLQQQATLIHQSDVILATHGAGLANLIFARSGTRVIEIVPDDRYNATCYPRKSRILSFHHQQVLVKSGKPKRTLNVSLEDINSALVCAEMVVPVQMRSA